MPDGSTANVLIDPAPAGAVPLAIAWRRPRGMWALSFANFLLRIATLGLYNFWGKTEVRARLWSGVRLNGEPLVYTGTGRELFLGFLVAMIYIAVPYGLLVATRLSVDVKSPIAAMAGSVFSFVISGLWGIAIYRARRYRLTRTRWRGIRGDLTGSAMYYAVTYVWTLFVVGVSLGWAHPWHQTKLQRIMVENTRFGDARLTFTADSGRLYGPFTLMWLVGLVAICVAIGVFTSLFGAPGTLPRAGTRAPLPPAMAGFVMLMLGAICYALVWLSGTWYRARSFNHYCTHTHLHGASFAGTASAPGLLWLGLSNALLALLPIIVAASIGIVVAIAFGIPLSVPTTADLDSNWVRVAALLALLSLGVFAPILGARSAGFWASHLQLAGGVPLGTLQQAAAGRSGSGEGLAQAFDIDVL